MQTKSLDFEKSKENKELYNSYIWIHRVKWVWMQLWRKLKDLESVYLN